jgi:hypothetical protein
MIDKETVARTLDVPVTGKGPIQAIAEPINNQTKVSQPQKIGAKIGQAIADKNK